MRPRNSTEGRVLSLNPRPPAAPPDFYYFSEVARAVPNAEWHDCDDWLVSKQAQVDVRITRAGNDNTGHTMVVSYSSNR